jgi:hypothetical protein
LKTFSEFLKNSKYSPNVIGEAVSVNLTAEMVKLGEFQTEFEKNPSSEVKEKILKEGVLLMKAIFKRFNINSSMIGYLVVPQNYSRLARGTYNYKSSSPSSLLSLVEKMKTSGAIIETGDTFKFHPSVKQALWFFIQIAKNLGSDLITIFKAEKSFDKYLRSAF